VDSAPEVITYSTGVQTTEHWEPQRTNRDAGLGDDDWDDEADGEADGDEDSRKRKKEGKLEKIRDQLRKEVEEELKATLDSTNLGSQDPKTEERFPLRTLSNDELEAVLSSNDFKEFVDQSSKVIDRALDEQYDLLIDYAQGTDNLDEDDEGYGKGRRGRRVKQVAQYWDERWSKKRMISDIDFSPKVYAPTVPILAGFSLSY
jgi:dynein intermediate chain